MSKKPDNCKPSSAASQPDLLNQPRAIVTLHFSNPSAALPSIEPLLQLLNAQPVRLTPPWSQPPDYPPPNRFSLSILIHKPNLPTLLSLLPPNSTSTSPTPNQWSPNFPDHPDF